MFSVKMTIDGEQPQKTVYSPSHAFEVKCQGDRRATIGWEAKNAWPDTDFKVIFSRRNPSAPVISTFWPPRLLRELQRTKLPLCQIRKNLQSPPQKAD